MNLTNEICIYKTLQSVYADGAYANLALDDALREWGNKVDTAYVTRVFYGVLENEQRYTFAMRALTATLPKPAVRLILKMGMYLLEQMRVPDYAAIDKCVELAKQLGKGGVSGFVNAVLRRFTGYSFPATHPDGEAGELSFAWNIPLWLAKKLLTQYDYRRLCIDHTRPLGTHIRLKEGVSVQKKENFTADCLHIGYYVTHNTAKRLDSWQYAVQSLSSMTAVRVYAEAATAAGLSDNGRRMAVLDLCAAPGGKAVYIKELLSQADVTACDIHPHRVSLIESYGKRMQVDLRTVVNDATVFRKEWENAFDMVVCDVPCSGIGVVFSKPDIVLNRQEADLVALPQLQKKILSTAARYVRAGGLLCYSTCTLLREENEDVLETLLRQNRSFTAVPPQGTTADALSTIGQTVSNTAIKLLPDMNGFDGFYIAALRKAI